jgi:exodeoxyribonuclease VII small subunit
MAKNEKKNDIGKMSFEEAIKELTGIVGKIEQGQIPLQDSLEQYEKGMALIKHCKDILQKAEKRIEKISEAEPKTQEEPEAKTQQETDDVPF